MTPKPIPVLELCVETGVARGFARAFKHNDSPSNEEIKRRISESVMAEIYEWFDFPERGINEG